jgi:hypothetical protein
MKAKETSFFIILLIGFLTLYGIAQLRVIDLRADLSNRLQVSAAPLPPILLKALAGEFKGIVADYLLLEAASFIGGDAKIGDKEWTAVARLLEQSSVLDPYFKQTYSLAQGTLPWHAQKFDETFAILERSRQHRTWDWIPGFFIAFNHFYFFEDHTAASEALMTASRVHAAPPALATWAARLASKTGQFQAAIEFLAGTYESTEDEQQKAMLKTRIEALQNAYVIQQAVDQFKGQYNRFPTDFDELVDANILPDIPINPYHRQYALNEGVVEF